MYQINMEWKSEVAGKVKYKYPQNYYYLSRGLKLNKRVFVSCRGDGLQ